MSVTGGECGMFQVFVHPLLVFAAFRDRTCFGPVTGVAISLEADFFFSFLVRQYTSF